MDNKQNVKKVTPVYQTAKFNRDIKTLTKREFKYFALMRSQYGVPFIKAKPGVAKSAIVRTIAEKLDMQYIDLRLSMADETDMQFPNLTFSEKHGVHVIESAIPEWAALSNERPTIIHFEELNRARLEVRNAALQILLERTIGHKFKFNENVFMISSGNLGDEDDTDVEEFDTALNNRLIHVKHTLTVDEWLAWARDFGHIHPDIIQFIELDGTKLVTKPADNEGSSGGAHATPRSWEMLSKFIVANFGGGSKLDEEGNIICDEEGNPIRFYDGWKTDKKGNPIFNKVVDGSEEMETVSSSDARINGIRNYGDTTEYLPVVSEFGSGFIGASAWNRFARFLKDRINLNLRDILEDFKKREADLANFKRDKYSELISEAKGADISKWSSKNVDNFSLFLMKCSADERTGFLLHVVDTANNNFGKAVADSSLKSLLRKFPNELKKIKSLNQINR